MSAHAERDAAIRELARKTVVCRLPGMDALTVRRDLTYRSTSGAALPMDLYYPPAPGGERPPAVILPMAYPDPAGRMRDFGPLTSWARLIAASGMASVVYGAEAPADDVHALLRQLRADAGILGLDLDRPGLFATSANVTVALATLIRDRRLRCAALLYGYTMDADGSTAVADMAAQAGFVNACAGYSAGDLPGDVAVCLVRAGQDQFPGLNAALDALLTRALARNLPLTLINHATGGHGFDLDEPTAIARGIVRQVLAFLQMHLGVPRRDVA